MNRLSLLIFAILLFTAVAGLGTAGCGLISPAMGGDGSTVTVQGLPNQALDTIKLIHNGGPYPYRQDGVVFSNREGLLPQESNGYYHEYTVKTPGSSDRGARRIITGKGGELYYTDDHYASFKRIVE
jgi:ribonuclease T1